MKNDELGLWNKVASFEFDKPNISLTFAKRLAKENGISDQFANQIVEEYRKFIFLCCVSKGQIAPSHFVDQAWHLHLTYTRSYWVDLCTNTIKRDLHHNPTEGGKAEDAKFKNLYRDTLELYESCFSTAPPDAVWPAENGAPEKGFDGIDKSKNWIIPKPNFAFPKQIGSLPIVAVIFLALLLGCTADVGSIPLILVVIVIIAIVVAVFRKSRRTSGDNSSGCSSGCGGGSGGDSHSHSHSGEGGHAGDSGHSGDGGDSSDSGGDNSDSGGGDSGCSSSGCSGGCGGGGD